MKYFHNLILVSIVSLVIILIVSQNVAGQQQEDNYLDVKNETFFSTWNYNERIDSWFELSIEKRQEFLVQLKEILEYEIGFINDKDVSSINRSLSLMIDNLLLGLNDDQITMELFHLNSIYQEKIYKTDLYAVELLDDGMIQTTVVARPGIGQFMTGTVTRNAIGSFSFNQAHGNNQGSVSVGRNSVNVRSRGWAFLNLPSIPVNATVTNANLVVFVTNTGSSSHRLSIGELHASPTPNNAGAYYNYIESMPIRMSNINVMTTTGIKSITYNNSMRSYLQSQISSAFGVHGISFLPSSDNIMQRGQFDGWDWGGQPRPFLEITYTTPTPPTLSVNPASLSFGNVQAGQCSSAQSYQVSGSNLTGNVSISAPTGFQVSTSQSSGFGSSASVSPSGGSVNRTIWVRFCPPNAQSYSDNVSNSTSGVPTRNVSVNGTGIVLPPPVPGLVSPSNGAVLLVTNPTLSWTNSAGASHYELQIATSSSFVSSSIVFNQGVSGTSRTVTLNADNTYHWRVRAVNSGGSSNWSASRNFSIQIPPSTINVSVRNIDNSPKAGAIVVRFNSNWQPVEERTTNSSGVASFIGLQANQVYHFQGYNPTPHVNENEFWGQIANINSGVNQTTSVTLSRRAPYSSGISYSSQNLEAGQPVTITVDVANGENINKNTRVRIQVARGTRSNVVHTEMKTVTLSSLSSSTINYTYTPTVAGEYFVRAHFTQANYENIGWITTDTWSWPDEVSFTVQPPPTSIIGVTVRNYDNEPREGAIVVMYDSNWQEIREEETNSSGTALFTDVPANQIFHFEGYNPTPHRVSNEYWGTIANLNSGENQTISFELIRKTPFALTYNLSAISVQVGEPITIGIQIENGENIPINTRVRLQIAKDSPSNVVHTERKTINAAALSSSEIQYIYTANQAGNYYIRAFYTESDYDGWKLTDTWAWPLEPAFSVQPVIGNLSVRVRDSTNNLTEGVELLIYENVGSGLIDLLNPRVTDQHGTAEWEMLDATKTYHLEAYKATPVIPNRNEYWGALDNVTIAPNTSNERTLNRNAAYTEQLTIQNSDNEISDSFFGGDWVQIKARVQNKSDFTQSARVVLQVASDTLGNSPQTFISGYTNISPNSFKEIPFSFQVPNVTGAYYVRPYKTEVNNIGEDVTLTDTWFWIEGFNVIATEGLYISSVSPQTTVTLNQGGQQVYTITIRDQDQNPVSGITVEVADGISGLSTTTGQTNSNGQVNYTVEIPFGFPEGQYEVTFSLHDSSDSITRIINVNPTQQIDAVIVTVDGIDFQNTGYNNFFNLVSSVITSGMLFQVLGLDVTIPDRIRDTSYMKESLLSLDFNQNIEIYEFLWNGNINTTAQEIELLDSLFVQKKEYADYHNAKFIIVSHSWGTLLSYKTLDGNPDIEVDLMVMLSSPLGTSRRPIRIIESLDNLPFSSQVNNLAKSVISTSVAFHYNSQANYLPNVDHIHNYWVTSDLVSGPLNGLNSQINDHHINEHRYPIPLWYDTISGRKWHDRTTLIEVEGNEFLRNHVTELINNIIEDNEPIPHPIFVSDPQVPHEIILGESFVLEIEAKNIGGLATYGSISVSFPSLADSTGIYIHSVTSNPLYVDFYNEGDPIYFSNGSQNPAQHLLIEYGDPAWDMNQEQTLGLEITPQEAGEYIINVRVNMGNLNSGAFYNNPIESETYDQQGWPVIQYVINVIPDDDDIPLLSVTPGFIEYEIVEIGQEKDKLLTITNSSNNNSTLSGELDVEGDYFSIQSGSSSFNLSSGQSHQVTVRFSPTGTEGVKTGSVSITHNAANQDSPYELLLVGDAVEAAPVRELTVTPTEGLFGDVPTGECTQEQITLQNSSQSTSVVTGSLSLTGYSGFVIEQGGELLNLTPGQSRIVTVAFCPEGAGNKAGTLVISHNATNVQSPTHVNLTGTGLQPGGGAMISFSSEEVNFGPHNPGDEILWEFTLYSDELSEHVITVDLEITGSPDFVIVDSPLSFSINPGENKSINLGFYPSLPSGPKNGTLQITHNAVNIDSPFEVELLGETQTGNIDFATSITVSDQASNIVSLVIGTSPEATEGFDTHLDQPAPPAPPAGTFDARVVFDQFGYYTLFLPTTATETEWPLLVRPSAGNAPITLEWDVSSLSDEGVFYLLGDGLSINMRQHNNVEINQEGDNYLSVIHKVSTNETINYAMSWNLVGMAIETEHTHYSQIFSNTLPGTLYGFNDIYLPQQVLEIGHGYWLFFLDEAEGQFEGVVESEISLNLNQGWNIISGHSGCLGGCEVNSDPVIILPGTIYGFSGTYFQTNILDPGKAYWVFATESGSVSISGGTNNNQTASNLQELSSYAGLSFIQNDQILRELYLGANTAEHYHENLFSLPPIPPSGIFDARFDGDLYLINEKSGKIKLLSNGQAVSMSYRAGYQNYVAILHLYNNNSVVDLIELIDGDEIELSADLTAIQVNLVLETAISKDLPIAFDLMQNYPNPFNPTTIIEYAVSEPINVRLEVFNLAGQLIEVLVNENKTPGNYTINFDASRLSSGVYMYRMVAGNYMQTRKMILVK